MSDKPLITVRAATKDDLRFVKSSWYESFRRGGFAWELGADFYHAGHAKVIDDLCARPAVRIAVAAATEVPDEICTWMAYQGPVLHYVYTKQDYRHFGIVRDLIKLIEGKFTTASHMTRGGKKLAQVLHLRYNPYLQFHPPK